MINEEQKKDQVKNELSNIKFHLTKEGSLGILAYGDIALQAWRKVKMASR